MVQRLDYKLIDVGADVCFLSFLHNIQTNIRANVAYYYPLDAELNPVCHLLALLGGYHILHVFRIRVKLRMFRKSQKYKEI